MYEDGQDFGCLRVVGLRLRLVIFFANFLDFRFFAIMSSSDRQLGNRLSGRVLGPIHVVEPVDRDP
jgi:hypothetical protein